MKEPLGVLQTALEASVQAAEDLWRRGDWGGALEAYRTILARRVAELREADLSSSSLSAADLVVLGRLADLAVPFGLFRAADELLTVMATLCEEAGNRLAADFATLKRIRLATGQGRLREAVGLLRSMEPSLGPVDAIAFTDDRLTAWESGRTWPRASPADRVVMFTGLYLEMGRLFTALGQYGDALGAFSGGLRYASGVAPTVLRLSAASALLEGGDLDAAAAELDSLRADLDAEAHPDAAVSWSELRGKLHLLRGEFGDALRQFRKVIDTCRGRGFHHARRRAVLNLAHVLILLNQTAAAERTLLDAIEETGEGATRRSPPAPPTCSGSPASGASRRLKGSRSRRR